MDATYSLSLTHGDIYSKEMFIGQLWNESPVSLL